MLRLRGAGKAGPSSAGTRRGSQSFDVGIIPDKVLDRQENFVFPVLPCDSGPDVTPALPLPANALFRLEDLRRVSTDRSQMVFRIRLEQRRTAGSWLSTTLRHSTKMVM